MGWSSMYVPLPVNRKRECEQLFNKDYTVIKSQMVGTVCYVALKSPRGDVTAHVVETAVDNKCSLNFHYNICGEEHGPVHYDCPPSILKLLTPTNDPMAQAWRKHCWETYQTHQFRTKDLSSLPYDTKLEVTLDNGGKYTVVKRRPNGMFKQSWFASEDGRSYIAKKRIKNFIII